MNAKSLNAGKSTIKVEATVTNSGSRASTEVVQVYIREQGTSVARPVRELKGFQRIALASGESRPVHFTLSGEDLAFWNLEMKHIAEPCELTAWVAPNCQAGTPSIIRIE